MSWNSDFWINRWFIFCLQFSILNFFLFISTPLYNEDFGIKYIRTQVISFLNFPYSLSKTYSIQGDISRSGDWNTGPLNTEPLHAVVLNQSKNFTLRTYYKFSRDKNWQKSAKKNQSSRHHVAEPCKPRWSIVH